MILNHLPISAYIGVLKFGMKIFVNVARLKIGKLFTQGTRLGHPCTLDTFLVFLELLFLTWYTETRTCGFNFALSIENQL